MPKFIKIIIFSLFIMVSINLIAQDTSIYFKPNPIPSYITRLPNHPKIKYEGDTYYKLNKPMLPIYILFGFPLDFIDASFGAINYIPLIGTFTTSAYMIPFVLTDKYDDQNYITTHYNFSHINDKGEIKKDRKWKFFPIFNHHWNIKSVDEKRMNSEYDKINQLNQKIDNLIEKYNKAVDGYKECLKDNEEISFINLNKSQTLNNIENEINRFYKDYETVTQNRKNGLRYNRHKWMDKEELSSELDFQQRTAGLRKYDDMMVSYLDAYKFNKVKDNLIKYKGNWITPEEKKKNQELEKKGTEELLIAKDEEEMRAIIDEEVLKIVKGDFEKLNEAKLVDSTPDSQYIQLTVINNLDKDLDILLTGPVSKKESVSANKSNSIVFNEGEYFVVFKPKGVIQKPYVLSQKFDPGGMYEINIGEKKEAPTDLRERREQKGPREPGEFRGQRPAEGQGQRGQRGQRNQGEQQKQGEQKPAEGQGQTPPSETSK